VWYSSQRCSRERYGSRLSFYDSIRDLSDSADCNQHYGAMQYLDTRKGECVLSCLLEAVRATVPAEPLPKSSEEWKCCASFCHAPGTKTSLDIAGRCIVVGIYFVGLTWRYVLCFTTAIASGFLSVIIAFLRLVALCLACYRITQVTKQLGGLRYCCLGRRASRRSVRDRAKRAEMFGHTYHSPLLWCACGPMFGVFDAQQCSTNSTRLHSACCLYFSG
jgi:hypothetical protein